MKELRGRVTDETYDRLAALAAANGITLTAQISLLINEKHSAICGQNRQFCGQDRQLSGGTTSGQDRQLPPQSADRIVNSVESGGTIGGLVGSQVNHGEKETNQDPEGGMGGTQKKKSPKKKTAEHPGFEEFWAAYPKRCPRRDRPTALRAWDVHQPHLDTILAALAWQDKQSDWAWTDEKGEYGKIPMPATWINQHRWERERPEAPPVVAPTETRQKTIEEIVAQYRHLGK